MRSSPLRWWHAVLGAALATVVSLVTVPGVEAKVPPSVGHALRVVSTNTTASGYSGRWGLYAPDFPGTLATVDSLQVQVGRRADYVMWYVHWAGPYSTLNTGDLARVAANGSTPVITWLSDDPTGATTITDRAISAGSYDNYIRTWATGLRALGAPVLLRLDPEMNGNWYGWSPGVNGQAASDYVAAYRHVVEVFASVGARNVSFVWSPNVDYPGASPMAALYPGDAYVSYVGLDGYNWGTVDGHVWQSPQQVFGPSLAEMASITRRPMLITEVASTSQGGDKAAWITSFFSYLHSVRSVTGFIWFDAAKETDWQVDSTAATLAALRGELVG